MGQWWLVIYWIQPISVNLEWQYKKLFQENTLNGLVQDCSNSSASARSYCSLAQSHQFENIHLHNFYHFVWFSMYKEIHLIWHFLVSSQNILYPVLSSSLLWIPNSIINSRLFQFCIEIGCLQPISIVYDQPNTRVSHPDINIHKILKAFCFLNFVWLLKCLTFYVLNFSEITKTYICILCHSSTLIWHRYLKYFPK